VPTRKFYFQATIIVVLWRCVKRVKLVSKMMLYRIWKGYLPRKALPDSVKISQLIEFKWGRRESNPHGLLHKFLRLARLPFRHVPAIRLIGCLGVP
jgi:hypothetical protein